MGEETAEFEFDLSVPKTRRMGFTFIDLDEEEDDLIPGAASLVDFDWNPSVPGTRFGDYEVTGSLGQGAMGLVLKGRHVRTHEPVAIKVLQKRVARSPTIRERFRREAIAAAKVSHENITASYVYGIAHDRPFIVLEHLPGGSVRELLERHREKRIAFPIYKALAMVRQVLCGLEAAHAQKILHRDIKPDNLLLDRTGAVKISDFGLVKMLSDLSPQMLTTPGARLGSPLYMAPEQACGGPVDIRADLYSAGMTLYELLTGKPAFEGLVNPLQIYEKQTNSPAPSPRRRRPQLRRSIDEVVRRLLEPEPDERFQSALEAVHALDRCVPVVPKLNLELATAERRQKLVLKRGERIVIGRAGEAGMTVRGTGVSRFHCAIELTAKGLVVMDLESKNGTFVGNRRIKGARLLPSGASLRIGTVRTLVTWSPPR